MNRHQRIIIAIGMVFIVAFGLWPPFQYRGQYEGQHFLFDPAYNFASIDLTRLGIGWLSIGLVFSIVLLLYKVFSFRAIKVFGLSVAALVLITGVVALVVKSAREKARRQAYAALVQQARTELTAGTVTNPSEGHFILKNPTKWILGASLTVDYVNAQHLILFNDNKSYWSSTLRAYGQEIIDIYPIRYLSQGQLPEKTPFIQRVSVKYHRAVVDDKTVELDPPFELVSERCFVFYPEEWGWDELTKTSYLRGPVEFKEVPSNTQQAPPRRLAVPRSQRGEFGLSDDAIPDFRVQVRSPRSQRGKFKLSDIEPDPKRE